MLGAASPDYQVRRKCSGTMAIHFFDKGFGRFPSQGDRKQPTSSPKHPAPLTDHSRGPKPNYREEEEGGHEYSWFMGRITT